MKRPPTTDGDEGTRPPTTDGDEGTRPPTTDGDEGTRLDRELRELVEEVRVLLPGVQVVFAFLLTVPFAARFDQVDAAERAAYGLSLLAVAVASALLIAPTALHRLRWRRYDKEWLLRVSHRLVLGGTAVLGLALPAGLYLVTSVVFSTAAAVLATVAMGAVVVAVWFLVPLRRAARRAATADER